MDGRLLILIERERSSGCYDMAVFGGFGSFVAELGDEPLARLGLQYGASPRAQRPQLLAQIEARVRELVEEPDGPGRTAEGGADTETANRAAGPAAKAAAKAAALSEDKVSSPVFRAAAMSKSAAVGAASAAVSAAAYTAADKPSAEAAKPAAAAQPAAAQPAAGAAAKASAKPGAKPGAKASVKSVTRRGAPTSLDLPLTSLPQVGAKRAEALARLGLHTLGELLERPPRAYRDRSTVTPIEALAAGDTANIRGRILHTGLVRTRRGFVLLTCQIEDETAALPLIWFNQPFLEKVLRPGRTITAYGRLERRWDKLSFLVQDFQLDAEASGGIVPVYDLTAGISNKQMLALVAAAWQRGQDLIGDLLPESLREKRGLPGRRELLHSLHFPRTMSELEPARQALAYEELLILSLALLTRQQADRGSIQRPLLDNEALKARFTAELPFSLTKAQLKVIDAIYADQDRPRPLARLVQGDVGSGKTMVAAAAIFKCVRQGRQAALMAPTEILARQHYENLAPLFDRLGLTSALLTGSTPAARRREVLSWLAQGQLDVIIGTHALIQNGVDFFDLGLAVTDEQHRFGVAQRARLGSLREGCDAADVLIMTATPIPRTLALTIYGDLDLSLIDELPPGRTPVRTFAVDYSYEQRLHAFVEQQIAAGGQAFIVCPLIDESDESDESELASATEVFTRLSTEVFPQRRLALLHGRMKAAEKDAVMAAFRAGETDILVSTTVIEVGIDVPNASVMLVRDAERFGLAQLHQLRGRIGRGQRPGFCLLLHNAKSEIARERMRIICQITDGYALAEADLRLRGPGEVFGERQSGLPELQAADILRDAELLTEAHADAAELLAQGPLSPALAARAQALAARLN